MSGAPDSVSGLPGWADLRHQSISLLGGRFIWQRHLKLSLDMGPGDVLVVSGNPRFLSNLPMLFAARRKGLGILWWGHDWSPTSAAWRARIRRAFMRRATVSLLYTDEEIKALIAREHEWPTPLFALNNTIDTEPSDRASAEWTPARLAEFRKRYDLDGKRLLLFCGRLRANPSTELVVAMRAFAQLYAQDKSWRFAIVGTGEEGELLRQVERQLKISSGMLWPGAIYDEADLAPWFLCASCLVYPGAIGLVLLHAFSYGLPVVTHSERALHNPEIAALEDGVNGITFQRGNAADLAEKLQQACDSPQRRQRMSAAALRTVATTFSFSGMVQRFSDAIMLASKISVDSAGK
jgi:glycosyltransferase involved in cell wall biosynthesis